MKITIESTDKVIELVTDNGDGPAVPARVWEGKTESGIPVVCFVTRIAPVIEEPVPEEIAREFAASLQEQRPPTPAARRVFDLRMIL
jgi:hypothetical protein